MSEISRVHVRIKARYRLGMPAHCSLFTNRHSLVTAALSARARRTIFRLQAETPPPSPTPDRPKRADITFARVHGFSLSVRLPVPVLASVPSKLVSVQSLLTLYRDREYVHPGRVEEGESGEQ